jgi:isorenieratene synthase
VHAYALPDGTDEAALGSRPQPAARPASRTDQANVVHEEWLVRADCPLVRTEPWRGRPEVSTPDPDHPGRRRIRCDYPVALMERAATTGWMAANHHLSRWGLPGHDLWTVPMTDVPGGPRPA